MVTLQERLWQAPGRGRLRVFAAAAGVRARGKSLRLQRALCDFGVEDSFGKSSQRIKEHYGFELSPSAVREVTLHHAARANAQLEAHYEQSFRALPRKGPARIVAQTDGTMICTVPAGRKRNVPRPRQWKEMRLSVACAQGRKEAHYAAGFSSVEETGRRWAHCARDAGWALESRIHVVADGAEWIRLQSEEVFGGQADMLVDFYHVSEYLAAAAAKCRPQAVKQWLRTQQKRLKRGALAQVLEALSEHEEPEATPEEEAPVRAARRYLANRRENLDYKRALEQELPIGSGLVESGNKHLLQARLKQAGSAWNAHNADAIAQLRVLRSNSLWDAFWPSSLAA